MANSWDPDVAIDAGLASRLIDEQFPELAPAQVRLLGAGWDNAAYVVNGAWVFRLPTRAMGAALMQVEIAWLPRLAPHLPERIPVPEMVGRPTAEYPYPFAGYRLLPGTTACRVTLTPAGRARLGEALGSFLRALHGIPMSEGAPDDAPGDTIYRSDMARRLPILSRDLAALRAAGLPVPDGTERLLEDLAGARASERRCWVHGDLYARHLLVEDGGRLTGVIDWGDMHAGDPALDISVMFSFLPAAMRGPFREAYGVIDEDALARARFRALHYASVLIPYGRAKADAAIERVGQDALAFAMEP